MSEQLALLGEAADGSALGVNQALVLTLIREYGRVERDEAGAAIHARQGRHAEDERCDYCASTGRAALASLSKRGHRNGRPGSRKAGGGYDPATSAFPEGF